MTVEQYGAGLGLSSWEVDFFGRIRSLADRAMEEYLATEQARRSTHILLVSEVGNAYLTLAADRETLELVNATLEAQQAAYDLVRRRLNRGLVPELDLYRAQTQVDIARGDVARFTQLVAQDENALNLLVGSPVSDDLLPAALAGIGPLKEISPRVPSEVLLRRPDILQAEALLKAANANIGAARAAFFPRISLTSAIGTGSADLSGLFSAGSLTWNYAPQIVVPVFDSRTLSAWKVTEVEKQSAIAQYEKAIQTAFREVADALAVLGTVDQQIAAQESLVHAAAETYRLSSIRHIKGIDSYLSVLDAQQSLYAAQQRLVALRLERVANQVRLYATLGGGWQSEPAVHEAR
jgi:multidrug efflux system outer membrane protein